MYIKKELIKGGSMMQPFSFQKGNKVSGCEDSPPIAKKQYSIVCDGLGGSGSTKHSIKENGQTVLRTSGYLGSRIVSDIIDVFYDTNYSVFQDAVSQYTIHPEKIQSTIQLLKEQISDGLLRKMSELGIDTEITRSKTLKVFPTTLASALYFKDSYSTKILAIWAGDSRVYSLSPKNGLQLLSMDDAINADIEMKSTSEMTNCISAANPFKLNYAIYELGEPAIVFCCSDGCFDYLPSPLHFEWLLLQTIISCVHSAKSESLAETFANSVRDSMYQSIGDDTTMSGVLFAIDTSDKMKKIYQPRMNSFGDKALEMNSALKEQKNYQSEKDSAAKKCRLFEEKTLKELRETIISTLKNNTPLVLYSAISNMQCYINYQEIEERIKTSIDVKCIEELDILKEKIEKKKQICMEMIACDYLKWIRINSVPTTSASYVMDVFTGKTREIQKKSYTYLKSSSMLQLLNTCMKLLSHPSFRQIGLNLEMNDDDYEMYIQSNVELLETLKSMFDTQDPLFEDMWRQAYFMTNRFLNERQKLLNSREFLDIANLAFMNPTSCQYICELTYKQILEYTNLNNEVFVIQQKYITEKNDALVRVQESFWDKNKEEIIDFVNSQSSVMLESLFNKTDVSVEKLISLVESKKIIENIDQRLATVRAKISALWEDYRIGYQLFNRVTEKGVI